MIFAFLVFSGLQIFFSDDSFLLNRGFSAFWLFVMYLLGSYIKKYGFLSNIKTVYFIIANIIIVLAIIVAKYLCEFHTEKLLEKTRFNKIILEYFSPGILISGILVFLIFERISISNTKVQKKVAYISSLTFSVYIIHENIYIQNAFIKDKFSFIATKNPVELILLVLSVSLIIFCVCLLIDSVRHLLFKVLKFSSIYTIEKKVISNLWN